MPTYPRVFISYSHYSPEHAERVRGLCASLVRDGCECQLDVHKDTDEDWPLWMSKRLQAADFIVCIVTETYARRFNDEELHNVGLGVGWEAGLIRRLLYARKLHNNRIFPALFEHADQQHIPLELSGYEVFTLDGPAGYEALLRKVLKQPLHARPVTGTAPHLPTLTTPPLFARPGDEQTHQTARLIDLTHFDVLKYAPEELVGRTDEMKLLSDAWDQVVRGEKKRPHILSFVALGGEGKTSLVAKWAANLAGDNWPGCEAVFVWSFYSQGTREQLAASSDTFLSAALTFFGDAPMAGSATGAFDKGKRLSQLVGERRALLILDGVEPLQYAPTSPTPGELRDQGLAALLQGLAASNAGLCVVTTRYDIPDLHAFLGKTVREESLTRLSQEAGVALLKKLGVKGTQAEFEKLVEDVQGHALTLNLLGSFLRDGYGGDIRRRDLIKLEEADAEEQGGHAFRVMDAYTHWFESAWERGERALAVLRLMGLFDRPATADCLNALWQGAAIAGLTEPLIGLSEAQRNLALTRLEDAKLLTVNREEASRVLLALDAHPLLREYFAKRLREQQPEAWRAAHRRLYEHLCATTKDKAQPTLEDLQPLYQAVAHGCRAGMIEEARANVYFTRIIRGVGSDGFYSTNRLSAHGSDLGAIACFFETPWTIVSTALNEADQGWLLLEAAFCLRAVGRLTEALAPLRSALEMGIRAEDWKEAAIRASTLSGLELTLGEVFDAIGDAERSVIYAEHSDDVYWIMSTHKTHAHALHQAGRRKDADRYFLEAERMQSVIPPEHPPWYSARGSGYCDLLLDAPERAAWQIIIGRAEQQLDPDVGAAQQHHPTMLELPNFCRAVSQRAAQTLKIAEAKNWLLDSSLDHLTLGLAAFYAAILESSHSNFGVPRSEFDAAVTGLRRAGQDILPHGLLSRAWLRFLEGTRTGHDSAQSDLDEAWEIAERGPMRLFMADIHLYRARLFGGTKEGQAMDYPWESAQADLAAARRLIEQCGYGRRKEELEDAEAAILAKN